MTTASRRGRLTVLGICLVALAASCTSSGRSASPSTTVTTTTPPGTSLSPSTPASPNGSPSPPEHASKRVTVTAPPDGSVLVHGTYPHERSRCVRPVQPTLNARYPGTLTASRATDGTITLTVALPFERYLDGIAEVPASWPEAALRAQAIAARTYALASTGWRGLPGERLKAPICASTSCQVFRGLPVDQAASQDVERWYAAVRATTGQVLLFDGRPADTLYSSTSNGRTYGNDEVFGTSPLPYLRPVPERADLASPTSHWTVRIPLADVATFLRVANEWPSGKPVARVTRRGANIVIAGGNVTRTIPVTTFRAAIDTWAPCLEPDRFPSDSWKGTRLPVTVPSTWFRVVARNGAVDVVGRGYGHGVGMVQWGAYGRALRGATSTQILGYYYGGLRPVRFPEPAVIRVQVASGLTSLRVTPSGAGATLNGAAISGPLRITGGAALTVTS